MADFFCKLWIVVLNPYPRRKKTFSDLTYAFAEHASYSQIFAFHSIPFQCVKYSMLLVVRFVNAYLKVFCFEILITSNTKIEE